MTDAEITETKSTIEFLEVHEGLMKEMLAIEEDKFTLHNSLFSTSILASIERRLSSVPACGPEKILDSSVLGELMQKLVVILKRMIAAKVELKAKIAVYEESRK